MFVELSTYISLQRRLTFVENIILNKIIYNIIFKFSSQQKVQTLEVNPLFDHFQNARYGVIRSPRVRFEISETSDELEKKM